MEANTTEFFKGKCKGPKFCSRSARAVFKACRNESKDDYWIAVGNRINLSSPEGRAECIEEAKIALREARQLCIDQRQARLEVCEELSEAPYDPQISPADFVYMETISSETANPYLPLVLGTQWIYKGETDEDTETNIVTVTGEIKEIEYHAESGQIFRCAVIRNLLGEHGFSDEKLQNSVGIKPPKTLNISVG